MEESFYEIDKRNATWEEVKDLLANEYKGTVEESKNNAYSNGEQSKMLLRDHLSTQDYKILLPANIIPDNILDYDFDTNHLGTEIYGDYCNEDFYPVTDYGHSLLKYYCSNGIIDSEAYSISTQTLDNGVSVKKTISMYLGEFDKDEVLSQIISTQYLEYEVLDITAASTKLMNIDHISHNVEFVSVGYYSKGSSYNHTEYFYIFVYDKNTYILNFNEDPEIIQSMVSYTMPNQEDINTFCEITEVCELAL